MMQGTLKIVYMTRKAEDIDTLLREGHSDYDVTEVITNPQIDFRGANISNLRI